MLYIVEIRRSHEELSTIMARVREWLDSQRFEPDAFRCTTNEDTVTCRLEFKIESEAKACAEAFAGTLLSPGEKSTEGA
jgi:hypothetical protein